MLMKKSIYKYGLLVIAVIAGLLTSRLTLLPLVDYLGEHSAEGGIKNGPWVASLKKGAADQNFIRKAVLSKIGIGNLTKEEQLIYNAFTDSAGRRLHSKNDYLVRFKSVMPVEKAGFWSITLYNKDFFLAENAIRRYSLGDKDTLQFNADGSFTILVSSKQPEDITNWLPAPENDYFSLNVRCYLPQSKMLDNPAGTDMPEIMRIVK
jgi:hypothetical protein